MADVVLDAEWPSAARQPDPALANMVWQRLVVLVVPKGRFARHYQNLRTAVNGCLRRKQWRLTYMAEVVVSRTLGNGIR
ncbi:MAG: hypothetical protein R3C49_05675 [Planctomycetaceae bacterium]